MMRWLVPALLALSAGACTSGGESAFERMRPQVEALVLGSEAEAPPAPPKITRAQLNEIPFATISVQTGELPKAFVVAVADNNGLVLYKGQGRRAIVFDGALLVATKGLSYDLSAVKHQLDDPVVSPRPIGQWPAHVTRAYQFSLQSREDYEITLRCTAQTPVPERIEIVELSFNVVRVDEICANGTRRFTNTYWVDPENGFIWKSRQWVGPNHQPYVIETVRPYARQT